MIQTFLPKFFLFNIDYLLTAQESGIQESTVVEEYDEINLSQYEVKSDIHHIVSKKEDTIPADVEAAEFQNPNIVSQYILVLKDWTMVIPIQSSFRRENF